MIRTLIAGEVAMYIEGLAYLLGLQPDFQVLATAHDEETALRHNSHEKPDVVLVDMTMRQSGSLVRRLKQDEQHQLILALAMPETEQDVLSAAEAGLSGYIPRTATISQLAGIVTDALRGELRIPPEIASSLFRRVNALSDGRTKTDNTANVTRREMEIVALVDHGLSNKEIACLLGIEVSTVKNHIHNLLEKMQACSRGELAARLRPRLAQKGLECHEALSGRNKAQNIGAGRRS